MQLLCILWWRQKFASYKVLDRSLNEGVFEVTIVSLFFALVMLQRYLLLLRELILRVQGLPVKHLIALLVPKILLLLLLLVWLHVHFVHVCDNLRIRLQGILGVVGRPVLYPTVDGHHVFGGRCHIFPVALAKGVLRLTPCLVGERAFDEGVGASGVAALRLLLLVLVKKLVRGV